MTNSKVIGVIGFFRNAGLPILNNLNKTKKYQLIAYDIDEHKLNLLPENITRASSIKELAQKCHATITCLPKPEHVLQAVEGKEGLLENASPGMVWIDTSTTDFKQSQELEKKALTNNVSMLDSYFDNALQNNNMVSLAGGNKEIFNEWKELIQDAIGEVVVLCGDIGAGAIAKVVSNMLFI